MIRQQQSLINYSIQNAIILQNLQFLVGVRKWVLFFALTGIICVSEIGTVKKGRG